MKYKISFWDGESVITNANSLDDVIEYLHTNETKRIYEIMTCNNELSLWKSHSTLLWNNEFGGSLWFNLDTGDR